MHTLIKHSILSVIITLVFAINSSAAWTTTVISKTVTDAQELRVDVSFVNGSTKFQRTYVFRGGSDAQAELIARVRAEIDAQDTIQVSGGKITVGPLVIPSITPTVDPDQILFLNALRLHRQMQTAVSLGIYQPADKVVTDAASDMRAKFKPEYIVLLGF